MDLILVICALAILSAVVFNIVSLKKLKNTKIDEKYYWELKYENQFLIGLFGVVVFVGTFIGWSSYRDLKNDIKETISKQIDEIVDVRFKKSVNELNENIEKVTQKNTINEDSLLNTSKQAKVLKSAIDNMHAQVDQKIYVVKLDKLADTNKIYFKNLKTIQGYILPEFKEVPIIFITKNNTQYSPGEIILEVTREYVRLGNCENESNYSILIVEK